MENLKKLRKEKKISQNAIAQKLGMSFRKYQNIEYGVNETDFKTLLKLADFFGCSVDYLLGHQAQGIIHLDSYTPLQQDVISKIQLLEDDQLLILSSYIDTMSGKPLSEILENAKNKI